MGFMSGVAPKAVAKRDLVMDVSEIAAHDEVAKVFVQFMDQIIMGKKASISTKSTTSLLAPLIEAMELEGFYGLKDPCYASPLVGPTDDPTCQHGAPWHN